MPVNVLTPPATATGEMHQPQPDLLEGYRDPRTETPAASPNIVSLTGPDVTREAIGRIPAGLGAGATASYVRRIEFSLEGATESPELEPVRHANEGVEEWAASQPDIAAELAPNATDTQPVRISKFPAALEFDPELKEELAANSMIPRPQLPEGTTIVEAAAKSQGAQQETAPESAAPQLTVELPIGIAKEDIAAHQAGAVARAMTSRVREEAENSGVLRRVPVVGKHFGEARANRAVAAFEQSFNTENQSDTTAEAPVLQVAATGTNKMPAPTETTQPTYEHLAAATHEKLVSLYEEALLGDDEKGKARPTLAPREAAPQQPETTTNNEKPAEQRQGVVRRLASKALDIVQRDEPVFLLNEKYLPKAAVGIDRVIGQKFRPYTPHELQRFAAQTRAKMIAEGTMPYAEQPSGEKRQQRQGVVRRLASKALGRKNASTPSREPIQPQAAKSIEVDASPYWDSFRSTPVRATANRLGRDNLHGLGMPDEFTIPGHIEKDVAA